MSNDVTILGMRDLLRRFAFIRHDAVDSGVLREVGLFLITRIQARTAEGKDVNDRPFVPYSTGYSLFRAKKGRSTRVNLFWSGSMMSSMTFEEQGKEAVRLFFQNTSDPSGMSNPEKAFYHNTGAGNNPEREFFAISEEDRIAVIGIVESHIDRVTRRRR